MSGASVSTDGSFGPKPTWLIGSPTSASRVRADLAFIGGKPPQMTQSDLDMAAHYFGSRPDA
jgi:hypothetical protein